MNDAEQCKLYGVIFCKTLCDIETYINNKKTDINTVIYHCWYNTTTSQWVSNQTRRMTLMEVAVRRGDPNIINYLLEKGADINKSGEKGKTSLTRAVEENDMKTFKLLISNGADVNLIHPDDGNTPLAIAVRGRATGIAKHLINVGANIFKVGKNGKTPLLWAVENNDLKIITELLDHAAEAKRAIHTAFMRAIELQRFEIFQLLIKRGALINLVYKNGYTPLTKAIKLCNFGIIKELLENGADVNMTDSNGNFPLTLAVQKENFELVKHLVEKGADVTKKCLLIFAATVYSISIFQLLIDSGANFHSVVEEIEKIATDNEDFLIYFNLLKENMKKVSDKTSNSFTGHEEFPS